jgi:hypothetical protein
LLSHQHIIVSHNKIFTALTTLYIHLWVIYNKNYIGYNYISRYIMLPNCFFTITKLLSSFSCITNTLELSLVENPLLLFFPSCSFHLSSFCMHFAKIKQGKFVFHFFILPFSFSFYSTEKTMKMAPSAI